MYAGLRCFETIWKELIAPLTLDSSFMTLHWLQFTINLKKTNTFFCKRFICRWLLMGCDHVTLQHSQKPIVWHWGGGQVIHRIKKLEYYCNRGSLWWTSRSKICQTLIKFNFWGLFIVKFPSKAIVLPWSCINTCPSTEIMASNFRTGTQPFHIWIICTGILKQ